MRKKLYFMYWFKKKKTKKKKKKKKTNEYLHFPLGKYSYNLCKIRQGL